MSEFFGSIWWLLVSLGLLVTFHEFGHYWVARRCGVRVLRFSVGFGKPLWKRVGRDGTEWVVAAIPLGGYVKMLDEREGDVPAAQLHEAFTRKSVYQRFAIVAAGPLFNLVLTLLLLWGVFIIGKSDYQPVVGQVSGIALDAGFAPGDRILRIDGQQEETWTHAIIDLGTAVIDRRPVDVEVEDAAGNVRNRMLDLSRLDPALDETAALRAVGLTPRHWLLPAKIGAVAEGSPAAAAGLAAGDRVLSIDDRTIHHWHEIPEAINGRSDPQRPLALRVERDGQRLEFEVAPRAVSDGDKTVWQLGVQPERTGMAPDALLRYGPFAAIGAAARETWKLTHSTLGLLTRMVTGAASLQNVSGPISIARYANSSAQMGVDWFLSFLALLSLSLCIMNLLPIPILDGGHLLYYLIEMIKGSPVSERALIAGQYVGMAMLAGLLSLAFYNDIARLL